MSDTKIAPEASQTASDRAPSMRRAWIITGLLVVFMLINNADKSVIAFAGVQIQKDLGLSAQQFGLVQSGFFWLFAVGALFFGALASRVNLRWLLAGLVLVWVVTMVPLLGPIGFGTFLICRVVLGFAEGPAFALANHAVHSWFPPEKRATPSSMVSAGASIGTLIAAPVLTWIIARWNWHAAFYLLIPLGIVWAVAWMVLGRRSGEAPTGAGPAAAGDTVDAPYRVIVRTGTVLGVALLMFCSYWSTTLKVTWLPVYLEAGLGYDKITVGRLVMIPYAIAAVGAIAAGWLSGRLLARGVSRKVARGYLCAGLIAGSGVAMAGFTVIDHGWPQIVLVSLAFSLNTAAYGVALSAVADVVHAKKRGMVLGGLSALASISGMIAPLVLGFAVGNAPDTTAGYGFGFLVSGILLIAGSAIAVFMVNPDRDIVRVRNRIEETV
ncbi:MFS transporter [Nocardia sp. NPDC004582]